MSHRHSRPFYNDSTLSVAGAKGIVRLASASRAANIRIAMDFSDKLSAPSTPCRILVVDDEPSILTLLRGYLTRRGYEVLTARDGQEAISEAEDAKFGIDLLVTDIQMPRVGGLELAHEMLKECQRLSVLFMSADSRPPTNLFKGIIPAQRMDFVAKPFDMTDLIERVERLLETPG